MAPAPKVAPLPKQHEPEAEPARPAQPVVVVPVTPVLAKSSAEITLVDNSGHPISDARITIKIPAQGAEPAQTRPVPLRDRNLYVVDDVPVGEIEFLIEADLLKAHTQTASVVEGKPLVLAVTLLPAATLGSQLRGLVRSYTGTGLKASIQVDPGTLRATCGDDGSFELALPPGNYKVLIEAEGYRAQRRSLQVREEGVTVLNADLQELAP
jgi:hypothetical protein